MTASLEQRVEQLERDQDHTTAYAATTREQVRELITALTERLERLEHRQDAQRERLALAGITTDLRSDRG